MQQAQLVTLSKTQEFFNYKADRFTYTQNFDRELAYGISTERFVVQVAVGTGRLFSFDLKSRQIDYVARSYLELDLPQVRVPVETNAALYGCRFAWCPNIGNALIKSMAFKLGGVTVIQKMTGFCINMLHEMLFPFGKMELYSRMVGNDGALSRVDKPSNNPNYLGVIKSHKRLLINLPYSFCMSREDALPMLVFTNIQSTIEVEFIDDIRSVCIFNDLMKQYVENLNFMNAAILLHGVAVIPKYRTLMTDKAKYPYLFKEVECKSVVSPGEEPSIKLNQASNNSVIESYWGAVCSGSFNIGKKFLVYKSGSDNDSWKDGINEAAHRIAASMIRLVAINANAQVEIATLPPEWFGNQTPTALNSNVVLMDPTLGYVTRPTPLVQYGLAEQYLRIKVPAALLGAYHVYVCLNTLTPKNADGVADFCLNNKISEITVDGFLDGNGVILNQIVTATRHKINLRDISLSVDDCYDTRPQLDKALDLSVNDPFNTGVLIDGSGHMIEELTYNINGWKHEEPYHETHVAAQMMSVLVDKSPTRPSMYIIPFSGKIENKVWPDSSADLSRLESTELILDILDQTEDHYTDSPFFLFNSDFRDRGCVVYTFCTYIKYPVDINKGQIEYIAAENIRHTIDSMIRLKSKFRIEMPAAPVPINGTTA